VIAGVGDRGDQVKGVPWSGDPGILGGREEPGGIKASDWRFKGISWGVGALVDLAV